MVNKTLSVIVPVYNAEKYLRQCVDSILAQTYEDLEIILVDDGSTDGSGEICDEYGEKFASVKTIHQINKGVVAARKEGISKSSGDYITFVDSDDWVDKELISGSIAKMESDDDIDIFIAAMTRNYSDGTEKMICASGFALLMDNIMAAEKMLGWDNFRWELCGKVYRKKLFDNVYLDESIRCYEDLTLNWQLFEKAKKVYYEPEFKYHYRFIDNSASNTRFDKSFNMIKTLKDLFESEWMPTDRCKELLAFQYMQQIGNQFSYAFLEGHQKYERYLRYYHEKGIGLRGWIKNDQLANSEFTRAFFSEYDKLCQYCEKVIQEIKDILTSLSTSYKNIYIYGAGDAANFVLDIMINEGIECEGFVISDGQPRVGGRKGYNIITLSELVCDDSAAVFIVSIIDKGIREAVHKNLADKGFNNFVDVKLMW